MGFINIRNWMKCPELILQCFNFYTAEGFEEKIAHKNVKTTMPPIDANISLSIVLKFFLYVNVKSIINNYLLVSVVENKCKRGNDWKCVKEPKMSVRRLLMRILIAQF